MSLDFNNEDADRLARALAATTGESVTVAVCERLDRVQRRTEAAAQVRRSPAGPKVGNCFTYALAPESGQSLLVKGDDLSRTDVVPALDRPGQ